jgi:hypothetical protein
MAAFTVAIEVSRNPFRPLRPASPDRVPAVNLPARCSDLNAALSQLTSF